MIEEGKVYTYDEVQHLIAREVAKQRLSDVERQVGSMKAAQDKDRADVMGAIEVLKQTMTNQHESLVKQLERDFEKAEEVAKARYVSQIEFEKYKSETKQELQKLRLQITIPLAVLMVVLQVLAILV